MPVPREIKLAAEAGDVDTVKAWLDAAPRDLNNVCEATERTLLNLVCSVSPSSPGLVAITRLLLAHGADPNLLHGHYTPLHLACGAGMGKAHPDRIDVLLRAGARTDMVIYSSATPLLWAIISLFTLPPETERVVKETGPSAITRHSVNFHAMEGINLLLRAGSPLRNANGFPDMTQLSTRGIAYLVACKQIFVAIQSAGSLAAYRRIPRKKILVLRSLVNRGRAKTEDPVMKFLCRLGDNGVIWNVLSYWRAFEPGAFEAGVTTVF